MPQEIPEDKKDNPRGIKQDLESPNQKQVDDEESDEDGYSFEDMMEGNDLDPDPNDEDND